MTWQGKGSTWSWRKMRAAVLERDGHRCQINGPHCDSVAVTVHHRLGRGVSEDPADLEAACWPCNHGQGSPESSAHNPPPTRRTQW